MITELFSPSLKKLWKEWELRVLVLLSLAFQIILITQGNRRKYIHRLWIRIIVWSAYLAADYVATTALGVLSNNLGEMVENDGSLNANIELSAFWAPFLLLHLGGPDTITAYSLEDNELWLRHLLGLAIQTGVALNIFFMAWTSSRLSILAILMTTAGLIKYGERTWVLWSASYARLRETMFTLPDLRSKHTRLIYKYKLNEDEGYIATADMASFQPPIDFSDFGYNSVPEEDKLLAAYGFLGMIKHLFLDAVLSSEDRETSVAVFGNISSENAFQIIEMELGFMYDTLYTKAILFQTSWGIGLRLISFLLTNIVLVLFSLAYCRHKDSKIDLSITFLLLIVAIFLEVYAALVLVVSDRTVVWLRKHNETTTSRAISSLLLFGHPRWSRSMGQHNLLSYFFNEKSMDSYKILHSFKIISEKLEKQKYEHRCKVPSNLKEWIFKYFQSIYMEAANEEISFTALCTSRGMMTLNRHEYYSKIVILKWSTEADFEQAILVWHIATELCYYLDYYFIKESGQGSEEGMSEDAISNCKMSKYISRYMMYLLAMSPEKLPPAGVLGQISLRDTCAEAKKHFGSLKPEDVSTQATQQERTKDIKIQAFRKMFETYSDTRLYMPGMPERSDASLLGKACTLLHALRQSRRETVWHTIAGVWMELLAYAATQCRGSQHAQQLRQGGELLTHVWLLMAHFGLTQHFNIAQPPAIARARLL